MKVLMPVAGGAVRQQEDDDADDLPDAGMDTPVKVYCTEGTPAGGLSTAYSEASSIGGGSDTEDGVVDVDAAIASAANDVQLEHGGGEVEEEDRKGVVIPHGAA